MRGRIGCQINRLCETLRVCAEHKTLRVWRLLTACILALGSTVALVRFASSGTSPEQGQQLRLEAGLFDPLREQPPGPAHLSALDAMPSEYAIVQFHGPVQPSWRAALEDAGAVPIDYVPDYAYVVRFPSPRLAALHALPGVRWAGPYLPSFRLSPGLWARTGVVTVTVQTFPATGGLDAVRSFPDVRVLGWSETPWQGTARLVIDAGRLPEIAALTHVRWIEPYRAPQLVDDVAADLVGAPHVWVTLTLTGTGQIAAVADTGLDTGYTGTLSADFAGRLLRAYGLGRTSLWNDPLGHGTHVAGSVLGSGGLSGQYRGIAPGAQLVFQSLYSPTLSGGLYVPPDLNLLFAPPYADGARVHNNSWGVPGNEYSTLAQTADQFVWANPDMVIVVAAGNGGTDRGADGLVDRGSLYAPGSAKNVLSVGASESYRLIGGNQGTYGLPFAPPVYGDTLSESPGGLAAFSSRGPAADGRGRPDLVAPGTNIISSRSHDPSASCAYPLDGNYCYWSGSSQATPFVSGAALLVREHYQRAGHAAPSAALVKATLIHGASNLVPGQYSSDQPGTAVYLDTVDRDSVSDWAATGVWTITSVLGSYSPTQTWAAQPTGPSISRLELDADIDLSLIPTPSLTFWNRRRLMGSAARVDVYDGDHWQTLVSLGPTNGALAHWQYEGVDLSSYATITNARLRFEMQCTGPCGGDYWALDDIAIASGVRRAEVGPRPDPGQGWGRLDVRQSLSPSAQSSRWWADVSPGLETGETRRYTLVVLTDTVPLRVTLAWSDYPASPTAAVDLVNDLDLSVLDAGGGTLWPNGLAWSDRLNNVEQVEVFAPTPGRYEIVVTGHNVPWGPQPYALVVMVGGGVLAQHTYLPLVMR